MLATSASCGSFGSGVLSRDWRDSSADFMVRTGDQAVDRVSRQMAPCHTISDHSLPRVPRIIGHRATLRLTVWLLTLGCQTLVSNFMIGGRNGYSGGILMSIL